MFSSRLPQTRNVTRWPAAASNAYQSTSSVLPIDARGGDRQAQRLRLRGLVVRLVVGLGDDRAVDDDDQADRRDPLRRRDADLAGAERGIGRHGQPRLDRGLHRPSSASAPAAVVAEHLAGEPGTLAEQLPGPREVARPGDRDLGRLAPLDGGRLDAAEHRIRRLRPRRRDQRGQGEGGQDQAVDRVMRGLAGSRRRSAGMPWRLRRA